MDAINNDTHEEATVPAASGDKIYEIIYLSNATHLMSQDDLLNILLQCRKNNPPLKLTGVLLYRSGRFLQVLEGPKKSIAHMYSKISRDKRHLKLSLLAFTEIPRRSFSDWSMGFVALDQRCEQLEEFFDLLNRNSFETKTKDSLAAVFAILQHFRTGSLRTLIE